MPTAVRLHVVSPMLAVTPQDANPGFVDIPVGSVIETLDDLSEPGLHPVTFEGRQLLAFARDIRERSVRVRAVGCHNNDKTMLCSKRDRG